MSPPLLGQHAADEPHRAPPAADAIVLAGGGGFAAAGGAAAGAGGAAAASGTYMAVDRRLRQAVVVQVLLTRQHVLECARRLELLDELVEVGGPPPERRSS